jgi:hypothetical protein
VVVASEQLTARSPELLGILAERFEGEVFGLYSGALRIAFDDANPARLPLAASALREAMDDLEREGGFAHRVPDWLQRIAKLEKAWKVVQRSGGIEGFAATLDEFFVEAGNFPSRRSLAEGTLGRFDPTGRDAPPAVREARAAQWMEFREFFNKVLHRRIKVTDSEFRRQFEAFEAFLLDWLRPPVTADQAVLDELLAMGPPDA